MLETFTWQDWEEHLQEIFGLSLAEHSLQLTLVEVSGLGEKPGASREPFSLLFHGPVEPLLAQGVYALSHPRRGALNLFLVPLGPQGVVQVYEAVFT